MGEEITNPQGTMTPYALHSWTTVGPTLTFEHCRACQGCTSGSLVSVVNTARTNVQTAVLTAPTDVSTGYTYGNPNQMPPLNAVSRAVVDGAFP